MAKPLAYPYDLVRGPGSVTSQIPARGSRPAVTREHTLSGSTKGTALNGLPWGISLSTVWNRQTWGEDDRFVYYYPAQVTLLRVGPASAPTAAALTVGLDPQVVTDLTPTFLRLNDRKHAGIVKRVETTQTASIFETTWETSTVLKAGDVLEVGFAGAVLKPKGALVAIKHPVITLVAMGRDSRQRETGKTTVARLDSVWSLE